MRRVALLVAGLVVVGAAVPLAAGTASLGATAGGSSVQDEAAGNNSTAPGAQLASVVNVQAAEVEGDLAQRSFGIRVADAKSNASKAAVLAGQTEDLGERLAELRDRKAALIEAKRSGSISQARFRAEMAGLAAGISTVNQLLNRTDGVARGLPPDVLREHGVSTESLAKLRQAAGNLTGPEIAAVARNLTGMPNVTAGPPGNVSVGPPGNVTDGVPGVGGDGDEEDEGDEEDGETTTTTTTLVTTVPTGPPANVTTTTVVNVTTDVTAVGDWTAGLAGRLATP